MSPDYFSTSTTWIDWSGSTISYTVPYRNYHWNDLEALTLKLNKNLQVADGWDKDENE